MSEILIVSTAGPERLGMLGILRAAGYRVRGAASFGEATQLLATFTPDLTAGDDDFLVASVLPGVTSDPDGLRSIMLDEARASGPGTGLFILINAAIDVAQNATVDDPSGGILASWRTAGSSTASPAMTRSSCSSSATESSSEDWTKASGG